MYYLWLQSSSGRKWSKWEQTLLIYSHALLKIHVIGGQRSVRIGSSLPASSLPASSSQRSSNQRLRGYHLDVQGLLYGGLLPVDRIVVARILRIAIQPTSPSSPSRRHPGVPSVSSPLSVWFRVSYRVLVGGGGARSPRENLNLQLLLTRRASQEVRYWTTGTLHM